MPQHRQNQYTKAKRLGLEKPTVSKETRKKLGTFRGRKHSEETKARISASQKKAHAEGRAWNIGTNRWKTKPSYPEQFFMEVVKNEFSNQAYEYNKYFYGFWLDFAWPELKRCIEIDGKQHEEEDQSERDKRKDKLLTEHDWLVLRVKWSDMFHDTKTYIERCKTFIDGPLVQR